MKNPVLAKKLEGYVIVLPDDYGRKTLAVTTSSGMKEFAYAIVHNIDGVRIAGGGKSLNAMHIMATLVATIGKMIQNRAPKYELLEALDLVPKYLTVMITDDRIRQEAIKFFNGEMEDLRDRLI